MISNEVLEELKDTIHPSVVIERALASDLLQTRADLAAAREELERCKGIAIELSVLNTSLINHKGDLPEKDLLNFVCEIKRLIATILPLPPKEGEG